MKSTLIKALPLALALAGAASTFAADQSIPAETKKTTLATVPIDESKLSPASLKVARLLQSGVDEKVAVAYVKNNPAAAPTAEELVYLHQIGVPSAVLSAMLTETRKAATTETVVASIPVAAPSERVEVTSNYTPLPGASQPAQPQVNGAAVVSSPAPVVVQQQQPTVVYTQPAPVVVAPPPVVYDTRPVITFGFGFGPYYGHHGHYGHYHGGRHGWHH